MKARFGRAPGWARVACSFSGYAKWRARKTCTRSGRSRHPNSFPRQGKARRPRQGSELERMGNILVCDDERSICEMLDIALRREGHKVETVNSGENAKKKLDSALYDVIITDIKMPNLNGIEVLRYAHQVSPDSAVILIT